MSKMSDLHILLQELRELEMSERELRQRLAIVTDPGAHYVLEQLLIEQLTGRPCDDD